MNILLVMVPLSIVLLVGAGFAFFWAVEHDQFDDMDTFTSRQWCQTRWQK